MDKPRWLFTNYGTAEYEQETPKGAHEHLVGGCGAMVRYCGMGAYLICYDGGRRKWGKYVLHALVQFTAECLEHGLAAEARSGFKSNPKIIAALKVRRRWLEGDACTAELLCSPLDTPTFDLEPVLSPPVQIAGYAALFEIDRRIEEAWPKYADRMRSAFAYYPKPEEGESMGKMHDELVATLDARFIGLAESDASDQRYIRVAEWPHLKAAQQMD